MEQNQIFGPAYTRILIWGVRAVLLAAVAATGFLTTGCASTNGVASIDNNSTAPDPAWYQSNNNPFHAD